MTIATFHDLSGCLIELVPDAGIGLTGSNLTTWSDQSGNASNASVANAVTDGFATATGPLYTASDGTMNGAPSLTWGSGTDVLATALLTSVPAPHTFLVSGVDRSAASAPTLSRYMGDCLFASPRGVPDRVTFFRPGSTSGGPFDMVPQGYAGAIAARRCAPDLRRPFVALVINRPSGVCTVIVNGRVYEHRTLTLSTAPPRFSGIKLGKDFTNTVGANGQIWTGLLSLYVFWNRELTFAEAKDAMLLARTKCGVSWATGRAAA